LASLRPVARHGLSAALIAIYLGELALFLPLDFDFRPVFADIPLAPTSGEPTFGWPGWGEEVALAAKQLEQRIAVGEKVTLRYFYPGGVLGSGRIATVLGAGAAEYDEHEYFVISRLAVVEKLCVFPTGIPAEFTIGRSDRPYAWVFRGDRLKSAGFRFD